MKDNFSHGSDRYARFRPVYPVEFYRFLLSNVSGRERAWDCGTGNGQVAVELSAHFKEVFATDISANQLQQAEKRDNIIYLIEQAEQASFPPGYFDLITVGQAIHWFDFDAFYSQVFRVAKPGALLAAVGYGLLKIDRETDRLINILYKEVTGDFWDDERRYVDENYQTIPFPFKEVIAPPMHIEVYWSLPEVLGYLRTWSGVRHYMNATGLDPFATVEKELSDHWKGEAIKRVVFPLILRAGKVELT